jgi:uncharacterized protein (TIGR01244 family)
MVPVALSDIIAVGEVPTAAEVEILAKAGFRSLLNTQPDQEVTRLISSADAATLAQAAGMAYRYLPIASRRPDDASLAAFADAIANMPRPIYACCYSGARTAAAWALAAGPYQEPDQIIDACSKAGFDIGFLRPRLTELSQKPITPAPIAVATGTPAALFLAGGQTDPAAAKRNPVPTLTASVLVPRAASAGGFAVAG